VIPPNTPAYTVADKLFKAVDDKINYFNFNVQDKGGSVGVSIKDEEGVVLISSNMKSGDTLTIPSLNTITEIEDQSDLLGAIPVYIENPAALNSTGPYGEGSTIEVDSGAFAFIPYDDSSVNPDPNYAKQNYNGIIKVKAGGALLDQGGGGYSIGPAGYWFEYGSIALIHIAETGDPGLTLKEPDSGKPNGLWIAPSTTILGSDGAYVVWTSPDTGANGSGSFVWVAGSSFGINGRVTIQRVFGLSQDLKILPNSSVTIEKDLALAQEPTHTSKHIEAVNFSDTDMAGLGLSGGGGGQEIIVKHGVSILYPDSGTNTFLPIYTNITNPAEDVILVPATSSVDALNATYSSLFPWKIKTP
jgi:hypothetical protein